MNWLLLIALLSADTENIGPELDKTNSINQEPEPVEKSIKPSTELIPEPDLELLLFLAEWEDTDNDQWLDPEIFATDSTMNQQLDIQKANQNETDPDHN